MEWDRLIPGHPGPGDRLGTKKDVQDQLTLLQDASEAVKVAARQDHPLPHGALRSIPLPPLNSSATVRRSHAFPSSA